MKRSTKEAAATPAPVASASPDSLDSGLYWESKVADSLGIARDRLRAIRASKLSEGEDYRLVRREVVLSERGMTKLMSAIGEEGQTAGDLQRPVVGSPLAVPPGPPARARFQVVRVPANKHLLYAIPEGEHGRAPQVLIRVKDNAFFMQGMRFEAIEAEHNTWQYRGRLPRSRGKW